MIRRSMCTFIDIMHVNIKYKMFRSFKKTTMVENGNINENLRNCDWDNIIL